MDIAGYMYIIKKIIFITLLRYNITPSLIANSTIGFTNTYTKNRIR